VKYMGDGLLIEFSSAIDAVACVLEIQKAITAREAEIEEDRRIAFRMGVNLGDILVDGDDVFGDGVNKAARLQEIAEPGGICISGTVYELVKGKIDLAFRDLGHRKFKNIADPVRVYCSDANEPKMQEAPVGWPFLISEKRKPITAGGCLCGDVRYRIWSQPVTVAFCHCRHCQLALGAPVNAVAVFEQQNVTFEGAAPGLYRSSQLSERVFCKNCGTSIYTVVGDLNYYSIRVATLDNPADYPPEVHICVESQIPWVDIHDDLPRIRTSDDPSFSSRWVAVGKPKEGPTPPVAEQRYAAKRQKTSS
ncbi:MAG: GFA family protein, partial [Alphaproteobacteria bacterium]